MRMFGRYWGVDTPENWRSGLARAGSIVGRAPSCKKVEVVFLTAVVFSPAIRHGKYNKRVFSAVQLVAKRRKVRGAGRSIGDLSELICRIGLRGPNGRQYG